MFHGGDLHQASQLYNIPVENWTDLSTGINPVPYPVGALAHSLWQKLPSPAELNQLEQCARSYYGVNDRADIMAAPGSSVLIAALPALMPGSSASTPAVSIIKQSYQEHLNSWTKIGARIELVEETAFSPTTSHASGNTVQVIVNPNNPTGALYTPQHLLTIRENMGKDGLLIIDEAFMDCTPQHSLASLAGQRGLVILRSFGKFFGLAGLRLGFAIGHPEDIGLLRDKLGAWPVSGAAIRIASQALADHQWIAQTQTHLAKKSQSLNDLLTEAGLDIIGSTKLFSLVGNINAQKLQSQLARHAIWTRIFDYETSWIRIGLPQGQKEQIQLKKAIAR